MMTSSHRKRIYTRYGDAGETSLLYGGRVLKGDPHTEAYGVADEAVSAMGLGRALTGDAEVKTLLRDLEREMFVIMSELATDPDKYDLFLTHFNPVSPEMVTHLEETIDDLESKAEMPNVFILPGGSPPSAAIDLARSKIRTTERRAVDLKQLGLLTNDHILSYLNRLGDLLFVLARFQDRSIPLEKV